MLTTCDHLAPRLRVNGGMYLLPSVHLRGVVRTTLPLIVDANLHEVLIVMEYSTASLGSWFLMF